MSALEYFFQQVLKWPLNEFRFRRAKRPQRLPVVLGHDELRTLLAQLQGTSWLLAQLLYGTGVRLMEGVRLRVGDLAFHGLRIVVRNVKGEQDRVVPFPASLVRPLRDHLEDVRRLYVGDLAVGAGAVHLPHEVGRQSPSISREWIWQHVFPSARLVSDPKAGVTPTNFS